MTIFTKSNLKAKWCAALLLATSGFMVSNAKASDLEVFQAGPNQSVFAMMTLDNSGSMSTDSIWYDYGVAGAFPDYNGFVNSKCANLDGSTQNDAGNDPQAFITLPIGIANPQPYKLPRSICLGVAIPGHPATAYETRVSRLRVGVLTLLYCASLSNRNKTDPLGYCPNKPFGQDANGVTHVVALGISQFGSSYTSSGVKVTATGTSGNVQVPAAPINDPNDPVGSEIQLKRLADFVLTLTAYSGTPTGDAYAEAAAYFFGKSTKGLTYSGFMDSFLGNSTYPTGSVIATNPTYPNVVRNANNYLAPPISQCSAQGIYILTDGVPNNNINAGPLMQASIPSPEFSCTGSDTGWDCITKFAAKLLNLNADNKTLTNPNRLSIKTATVGFGGGYVGMDPTNCSFSSAAAANTAAGNAGGSVADIVNTCQLGMRRNQWYGGATNPPVAFPTAVSGQGGFYVASSPGDVTTSLNDFISNLNVPVVPVTPSGAIVAPVDPFQVGAPFNFAFMPLIKPVPGTSQLIWPGNLKKYFAADTYYSDAIGSAAAPLNTVNLSLPLFNADGSLNSATIDMWTLSRNTTNGNTIDQGGMDDQLPLPTLGNTAVTRNVVTDNNVAVGGLLTHIAAPPSTSTNQIDGIQGFLTDFDASPIPTTGHLTWSLQQRLYMLNYLGYSVNPTSFSATSSAGLITQFQNASSPAATNLKAALTTASNSFLGATPSRSQGGVLHSTPVLLSYQNALDNNDQLIPSTSSSAKRKDFVMFGSFEGGLHVVDMVTGAEKMVFVPDQVMASQQGLSLKASVLSSNTYMGVDAPWAVYNNYSYASNLLSAKTTYVFGGLRMGGYGLYGLDLTDSTFANPKLLFSLIPNLTGMQDTTILNRMGQIWAKPRVDTVRFNGNETRVLFVSGGYDPCYEDYQYILGSNGASCDAKMSLAAKGAARGNVVYMINIDSRYGNAIGKILWSTSSVASASDSSAYTQTPLMTNSIVSDITGVDRDGDGLVDNLWVGDLGGRIFRISINNASQLSSGNTSNFATVAVLADFSAAAKYPPRFYNKGVVTKQTVGTNSFVMFTIGSGNVSRPLSSFTSSTDAINNGLFGLVDTDVYGPNWLTQVTSSKSPAISYSNLIQNPTAVIAGFGTLPSPITASTGSRGWYIPFVTTNKLAAKKSMASWLAVGNYLFSPVYDPNESATSSDPCAGGTVGSTRLYTYCLPYGGICVDSTGKTKAPPVAGGIAPPLLTQPPRTCTNTTGGLCNPTTLARAGGTTDIKGNPVVQPIMTQSTALNQLRWFNKLPNSNRSY